MVSLIRQHFWSYVFLLVLIVVSVTAVKVWKSKHPGAMTVIEAQAMDMTVMKPPRGATPVATEVVSARVFSPTVSYTGSVAPIEEQVIYSRVEGWLRNLAVYSGDKVTQGQLLAVVDSPDLQSRLAEASAGHSAAMSDVEASRHASSRAKAEKAASAAELRAADSDLAKAKAEVEARRRMVSQAEAAVRNAEASVEYWRAEIRRESNLLKAGAVSQQEYDSEKAQAASAEAGLESAKAALGTAKAELESAKAEVTGKRSMLEAVRQKVSATSSALSEAEAGVAHKSAISRAAGAMTETAAIVESYRYVKAPHAGVITARYVSPGQFVTPSTAIVGVAQIAKVRLQANVSDRDLGRVHVGDAVTATFAKFPDVVVDARLTSVAPLADQESRTGVVEAIVHNPGNKLTPGDFVTMKIAVGQTPAALTVPVTAVVRRNEGTAVWVVRHEQAGKSNYYCTMHPEVRQDKPGTCPKCLMKLVPEESGGGKRAGLVPVKLGPGDGERVQVVSGLNEGDEVIYRGNTYLKEGDAVFPTRWTKEGPAELPPAPAMDSMPGMDHGAAADGHDDTTEMGSKQGSKQDHSAQTKDAAGSAKPAKTKQKTYVCPMDPEVTSHDPKATCPKCGMRLEEKR